MPQERGDSGLLRIAELESGSLQDSDFSGEVPAVSCAAETTRLTVDFLARCLVHQSSEKT